MARILGELPSVLEPVVHLLKEPNVCNDETIIELGVQVIDALEIVESEPLIRLIFDAIAK